MPAMLSSPPPPMRPQRSPSARRSSLTPSYTSTPPLPAWDTPTAYTHKSRPRDTPQSTPRQRTAPPVPPIPLSPAMQALDALPPPSPISRSSSSSSSSSVRIFTPPPKGRPRSGTKLLPAFPLSVNTQLTPPSKKRIAVDYTGIVDSVSITFHEDRASPRLKDPNVGTPPRPRRSSARRDSARPPSSQGPSDLLPPQASFTRSPSPGNESILTISESASTPRASAQLEHSDTAPPASSLALASFAESFGSTPLRKRDSAQRRLSALRGLVNNLDFNQPWSLSERTEEEEELSESEVFWACAEPLYPTTDDMLEPISLPKPLVHDIPGHRPRSRRMTNATPCHFSMDQPFTSPPVPSPSPSRADFTPVRQNSLSRKPNSTPPRRPRQFRSSSDLFSRTPDPPRPSSRHRREVFDVASSGYSKCFEPASPTSTTPTSTWRSSLSTDEIYRRVLSIHGSAEVKRQEIMWEMCETEQAFVKSMRTVLRLFAIPLKTPQGKWIQGIPERITELFDSLECVAHAHGIISATQRDMRRKSEVLDVRSFVAVFKEWAPRLDAHEWYLLRFEAVVQLVEENVRDPDSVFGEFVRMQMKEEVLGSMSLGSMLLKPVQRLTKYPLFLRRLLDVTPHPHPCHPELLSLLSSTESIILNLQATKAREEDYEQLQALESRLHGLPDEFTLAIRGRKLLGQGSVVRVLPQKDLSPNLSRGRTNSLHSSRGSISSTVSSAYSSASSPWDVYAGLTPSTCRTSAFSVSSSASSYCPPSRTSSIVQMSPQRPGGPGVQRSPSSASSVAESRPSTPSSLRSLKKKEEVLTLLIFSDLVVVATETTEKAGLFTPKRKSEKSLRVLQEMEGGIGKVIEVKDWSGWQGHSALFTVTILPFAHSSSNPVGPYTTALTLPQPGSPRQSKAVPSGCPVISSLHQFLAVLGQTATLPGHHGMIDESGEGKEVLQSSEHLVM